MPRPRRTSTIRTGLVFGAALAAALATAPAALASTATTTATGVGATGTGASATGLATTAHPSTVTLVTGEQVTVVPEANGANQYLVSHDTSGYHSFRDTTGDEYVIPGEAQAYLGRGLDRSLFDVTALIRDGLTGGAQVPVHLSYATGAAPAAPAGVTLTSTSGSTASGYVTPSSATEFGNALRAGIGADVRAGAPVGSTAPATGLTGMSLAAAGAPGTVTPFYPLYILTIDVTDANGTPDNDAFLLLTNTDQLNKQVALVAVSNGVAKIAVPAGDYSAIAAFDDFDANGDFTAARQVLVSDFTVQASASNAPLTIDEASATIPVTVSTPRPTTQAGLEVTSLRSDAEGTSTTFTSGVGGTTPFYVAAAAAPKVGKSDYEVDWTGTATNASDAYLYDAAFDSTAGIPADEAFTVRSDQVATVHQRLTADPKSGSTEGEVFAGAVDPNNPASFAGGAIVTMPQTVTHYFGTGLGGQYYLDAMTPNFTFFTGPLATFKAGRQYSQDWAHGPLTAGLGQYRGPSLCDACSTDGSMLVEFSLTNDSDPAQSGMNYNLPTAESLALYENGTPVFDEPYYYGASVINLPTTATKFEAVLNDDYSAVTGVSQSQVTHTDVSFTYNPAGAPGSALPAADECADFTAQQYVTGAACQILPVLTVNYQLAGLDLTNTSHSPVQLANINIGHLSYDGAGSRSPITSAALAVSWDNGKTWQSVRLAGFAGHYLAAWPNPPAGSTAATTGPELKVTATDAAGGAITQTVNTAYTVGSTK